MKKNWTTRVAVALLALTMITSCFVGSTFAKYVTKAEGQDNARVAKWGVLISVEGNAFATEYAAIDETYLAAGGELAVQAINDDQVVAPGTNSEEVGSNLVATISGQPEVATRYAITATAVSDVVLPAETYTDYTHLVKADDGTYGYTDTFTLEKAYAPVKWNMIIAGHGVTLNVVEALYANLPENLIPVAENYGLTPDGCSIFDAIEILKKVAGNDQYVQIVDNALSQIVTGGRNFQLDVNDDELTLSYDFDPNEEMNYTFTLSWMWAFENGEEILDDEGNGTGIYEFDAADTYLGNIAAGVVELPEGASITIAASLVASATQID